jgi:hypothetical protein
LPTFSQKWQGNLEQAAVDLMKVVVNEYQETEDLDL